MIATTIAAIRRDMVLDMIAYLSYPLETVPSNADITECVETAMLLIGTPWVWVLAESYPRDRFAKRLSAVGPIDLLVADTVHAYCRSH